MYIMIIKIPTLGHEHYSKQRKNMSPRHFQSVKLNSSTLKARGKTEWIDIKSSQLEAHEKLSHRSQDKIIEQTKIKTVVFENLICIVK